MSGIVLDKTNKKPVPSATVRIAGTNRGTICLKNGSFRLPKSYFINKSDIRITAIGYTSKTLTLDLTKDTVTIYLEQDPVKLKEVVVTGEIEVNEIIRRAIAKKEANRKKYKTMQGLLYSKFMLDTRKTVSNFNIGGSSAEQNTLSFNLSLQDSNETKKDSLLSQFAQGFIGENFSKRFIDLEKNIDKTIIVNRRQTANFPKSINQLTLENFIDFSQDEIFFLDTRIMTPLHKSALSYYKFELLERKMFENKYIYVIKVTSNTRLYPTFEGIISIIEDSYQLVEVALKPSIDTKIHLIDSLEYYEKFENVGNDIWLPTYMENKANLSVKILPFIPAIDLNWQTIAIVSDIILDQALPDSIYNTTVASKVIASDADSTKTEYWDNNALIALTDKEQEMYAQIDTAAKELKIDVNADSLNFNTAVPDKPKSVSFSLHPFGRYNRVESYVTGLGPEINISFVKLSGQVLYSLGQHRWTGQAGIEMSNYIFKKNESTPIFSLGAESFSRTNVFGDLFNMAEIYSNTIDMLIFHKDWYDYFRSDGWNTNLKINYKQFDFRAIYENRREFGMDKTTDKSIFCNDELHANPAPELGAFQLIKLQSSFGNHASLLETDNFQYQINAGYLFGIRGSDKSQFSRIEGSATAKFPIFETGYGRTFLVLSVSGGLATNNSPVQHLFVPNTSCIFTRLIGTVENTFITAYATGLGGTEFYSYHTSIDFKDWLWRLIRLPRIKGRGLELAINGTTGKFFNKGNTALSNLYQSTLKDYYTEVGFRIGRIPIPGSDLAFLAFELRFGIGEYAKGNWGLSVNFKLPF